MSADLIFFVSFFYKMLITIYSNIWDPNPIDSGRLMSNQASKSLEKKNWRKPNCLLKEKSYCW